jgi:glycosyltransferase involved in cell wall biosynthesis
MGAGLPVVVSRVSGAAEIIQDGVNGVLVPPGESEPLAAALLDLCRQPEKLSRLGYQAGVTVREHYSQETMLRRLAALYLELCGKDQGP